MLRRYTVSMAGTAPNPIDAPDVVEVVDVPEDQRFERSGGTDRDERRRQDADPLHRENGADECAAATGGGLLGSDGGAELRGIEFCFFEGEQRERTRRRRRG